MARSGDTRFEPNPAWFAKAMRLPGVQREQDAAGRRILGAAQASAPVDTGDYKRGIRMAHRESKHRRVTVVEATDPKSLLIEAKTGNLARSVKRGKG